MLVEFFLYKVARGFAEKAFDFDLVNGDFSLPEVLGKFIGSTATELTNDAINSEIKKISKRFREQGFPQTAEIQRGVRKAFLFAGLEAARFINRHKLYDTRDENKRINLIIDYFQMEINKFSDKYYTPEIDNSENKAYGYLKNQIKTIDDELSFQFVTEELNNSLFKELEYFFYVKNYGEIPQVFRLTIANGWEENSVQFSFFNFMCDYFHEFIQSDARLKSVLETEWLSQILSETKELKKSLEVLSVKFLHAIQLLGGGAVTANGRLDDIIKLLKPQPVLIYNYNKTGYNKLHFKSRFLNLFVGRDNELQILLRFFEKQQESFLWWAVTGNGGVGKSRLALELCHQLGYSRIVYAGFVSNLYTFDWAVWEPTCSTLIIVDHASGHTKKLISVLKILGENRNRYDYPVRLLIIERDAKRNWWLVLKKEVGDKIDRDTLYEENPLKLVALSHSNLWEIIEKTHLHHNKPLPDQKETLGSLRKIDEQGRPLFAWFAAFALVEGANIRDWNVKDLLRNQLEREDSRIYESIFGENELKEDQKNLNLIDNYKNLVAMATMCDGLEQDQVFDLLKNNYRWLPDSRDSFSEFYKHIADVSPFLPYKPDILGEFFVLKQLESGSDFSFNYSQKLRAVIEYVWNENPGSVALFLERLYEDFYDNPLNDLLIIPLSDIVDDEQKRWWFFINIYRVSIDIEKNNWNKGEAKYSILKTFIEKEKNETWANDKEFNMWELLAFHLSNMIYYFAEGKSFELAELYYNELRLIAEERPYKKIVEDFCEISCILVDFFEEAGDTKKSKHYYNEIKTTLHKHKYNRNLQALSGAVLTLTHFTNENNIETGIGYYEELKKVFHANPRKSIAGDLAQSASNLIGSLCDVGDEHTALLYNEDIKKIVKRYPVADVYLALSSATITLTNFLGESSIEKASSCYHDFKQMVQNVNCKELWLGFVDSSENLFGISLDNNDADLARYYYNEIKQVDDKGGYEKKWLALSDCAIDLVDLLCNQKKQSEANFFLDELRDMLKFIQNDKMYLNYSQAIYLVSYQYFIGKQIRESLSIFFNHFNPLLAEKNTPEIWLEYQKMLSMFLLNRKHLSEKFYSDCLSTFTNLYERYQQEPSWTESINFFNDVRARL